MNREYTYNVLDVVPRTCQFRFQVNCSTLETSPEHACVFTFQLGNFETYKFIVPTH